MTSLLSNAKSNVDQTCHRAGALLLIFMWLGISVGHAQDSWPQFRGAESRGIGTDSRLPDRWSTTDNVAWRQAIPGRGWSSPVVVKDRVFLTTVINTGESEPPKKGLYFGGDRPEPSPAIHLWKVLCFRLNDGALLWEQTLHEAAPTTPIHLKSSYASETPVSDGERLYVYFGNVGLFCLDLNGQTIWSQQIEPHKMRYGWGTAASPILHDGRLYVIDDNDEQSTLTALDAENGQQIWQVKREEGSNWSTPFVWKNAERTELITLGSQAVRAYDLNGEELWSLRGMSSITIATPYESDGLLFISSGYVGDQQRPLYAIRPGATGDISLQEEETTNEYIVWSEPQGGPYNPTTIVYEGRLYVLYDRGLLACYDAATGRTIYSPQRIPDGRAFTSSPWAYNGKLFCLNEDGKTFVFATGDEFKLLHINELAEDDMGMASPAIVGDRLLVRTAARLYCLQQGAQLKPLAMKLPREIFAEDAPQQLLEQGAGEGPAYHPELGVLFSGEGQIQRYDLQGKLQLYRDAAGSNGLLFDQQGRLIVCEPGQRRLTRTDLTTGATEVLSDRFDGMRYNATNDVTVDSRGRIYFSDPQYGPRTDMEMLDESGRAVEGVYRVDVDGSVHRIITHEVDRPNGLEVSADDRYLYVADNNNNSVGGARRLWRFDLQADGAVKADSRRLMFDWRSGRGPDGLVTDQQGRLYVAGGRTTAVLPYETADEFPGGVYVLSPAGDLLAFVAIPNDEVTNCTFGGPDLKTLYITAGGTLWSIRTTTAGRIPWPPAK